MPRRKTDACIGEEIKIAVTLSLQKFRLTDEQKELEFPSSFNAEERKYIHQLAQQQGFKSKSRGKGQNRFLTVYKKDGSTIVQRDAVFQLSQNSRQNVITLLQRFPITTKERQDLLPLNERERSLINQVEAREVNRTTGRLNSGIPQVPPPRRQNEYTKDRESLPIHQYRDDIIRTTDQSQVTLIVGETGSGKTTQVPQYILDNCQRLNRPCRIICTQSRRISAVSVAERVAAERDEKIGQTVGYQIRLESRVSPKTLSTFCTNGVLLRTLMGGDSALSSITHVIVDEVHERDKFSDFLLTVIRQSLPKFPNLKLVLMSASVDVQLYLKYFPGCATLHVPGRVFDVKSYYLEDVLQKTGYMSKIMLEYKATMEKKHKQEKNLSDWCAGSKTAVATTAAEVQRTTLKREETPSVDRTENILKAITTDPFQDIINVLNERVVLEPWLVEEVDKCISEAWHSGSEDAFCQFLHFVTGENVSVDYQHSETSATALMVAAGKGNIVVLEHLLSLGADVQLRASNDWTAQDWAENFDQKEAADLLQAYVEGSESPIADIGTNPAAADLTPEKIELLNIYQHSWDDDKVDVELILTLLHFIHSSKEEGAVLIFLPGYDEIVTLRERIACGDRRFADSSKYSLYILHSSMQSSDQKRVFRPSTAGVRKIILSTNISETALTINDVVFVIDSGKVKEKAFDGLTGVSSLRSNWASKANVTQRRGRAGRCRPGICYHLFSRVRYDHLREFQVPEILRVPLQDLCLHTKLLAPPSTPIADFLAKTPDPPQYAITRSAVQLLKAMDALDAWEDLTELGHHLLDLPIEPHLGKMVLYSVVLKCLDPILTIVCSLAYKDPFVMPSNPAEKRCAKLVRKKLSAGTYSDHMILLRAFQAWQKARSDGWERAFCEKNYICAATMEMIVGMRTQLLGQLRASGFVRARGGGDIKDLNSNSENWAVVKAALCVGSYPHMIRVDRDRNQLMTQKESKLRFHPSSVLCDANATQSGTGTKVQSAVRSLPSDWLIYEEMTRTGALALTRCNSLLTSITVAIFAGPSRLPLDAVTDADTTICGGDYYLQEDSDSEMEEKVDRMQTIFKLDDWVTFVVDTEAAHLAVQLRQKWHALFVRRMRAPSKPWTQVDEAVVRAVINVITYEEQSLGLQQPPGIGQRPRPMSTDYFSAAPTGSFSGRSSNVDMDSPEEPFPTPGGGTVPYKHNWSAFPPPTGVPPPNFPQNLTHNYQQPQWSNYQQQPKNSAWFSRASFGAGGDDGRKGRYPEDYSDVSSLRSSSGPSSPTGGAVSPLGNASESSSISSMMSGLKVDPAVLFGSGGSAPPPVRYFVAKAGSTKAIDSSLARGIWTFAPLLEKKLQKVIKEGSKCILIYSVQGSGHFQGYAQLLPELSEDRIRETTYVNNAITYKVQWIKRGNVQFQNTRHLSNPWNENRKVQMSRDGQELEPSVGEDLCKLWDKAPLIRPNFNQVQDGGDHGGSLGHVNYGRPIRGFHPQQFNNFRNGNQSNFFQPGYHHLPQSQFKG